MPKCIKDFRQKSALNLSVVGDLDQVGYWLMVDCISIKENFPFLAAVSYIRLLADLV
jgi:hypothetical protein